MKKIRILLLLSVLPLFCYGQFFGLGGQYASKSDGQFFASFSFPTYHKHNNLGLFMSSGMEYTTGGGAKMSGLNLKPIQLSTVFNEDFFNNHPYTAMLSVDGGYLFDFRHNRNNAIVITPNLYFDYKIFFVRSGYDFDVTNGRSQFFVRAGIGIGLGTLKIFGNTKLW